MTVRLPRDVSTIFRRGINWSSVSFILIFIFRQLQRKNDSDTTTETQSGTIASAVKKEQVLQRSQQGRQSTSVTPSLLSMHKRLAATDFNLY